MKPDVSMTPRAAQKIYSLLAAEGDFDLMLRVYVQGGGCSGLEYCFTFDPELRANDLSTHVEVPEIAQDKNDETYTAFELGLGKDYLIPGGQSIQFAIDFLSHPLLAGATIDYVIDATGEHFAVTNPNATGSCGCGASFSAN